MSVERKDCRDCGHCYMEPSDMNFICGHPSAGLFGKYVQHMRKSEGECGPEAKLSIPRKVVKL